MHAPLTTSQLNTQLDMLRTLYARQWNAAGVDAIICPANPSVASVHDESRYWGYSCVWNALDFSVAVIPTGAVKKSDTWDNFPAPSAPFGNTDSTYRSLYDNIKGPERYLNAPIGIQIVAKKLQEERLLQIVRIVERSLPMRQD